MKRLAGPTLMTALMLAVLIGLGVWQLHRLAWKRGILAAIDHAEIAPAIPLPAHPGPFQKVSVVGVLRPGGLLFGADVHDTRQGTAIGGDLIQPLLRAHGLPVLVDRGWVPDRPDAAVATPLDGVSLEGYVRAPERPGRFAARDDPAGHRFYTLDPAAMGRALGLAQVAPFTLIVLGSGDEATYPIAATALPRPPNDHLSYAITWFGLACVLVVIYGLWARRALGAARDGTA